MPSSSTPPASNAGTPPKGLRPELDGLVRALASLPDAERSRVYAAANEQAAAPTVSWDEWERARGVVHLGGNAVEDCDGLYDGA